MLLAPFHWEKHMSILDQIRKLDEQKAQLLQGAKKEALDAAQKAIRALNELGFNYRLSEGQSTERAPRAAGTRRSGIRNEVLALVKANPGINRSSLIAKMDIKGDKSAEQSLSNALAALKKAGLIVNPDGAYAAI